MPSLWFETALIDDGWARDVRLTVTGARIESIQVGVPPAVGDERGGIALPGLCNVHSHAFQRAMAGLTEFRGPTADDFWTWRELMYRFLDRITPEDVEAIAAQAYAEMLEAGFTRVGEFHYLHHDAEGAAYADLAEMAHRIVAAAAYTGIGLTLLPVFYLHANFGGAPPSPGQRRFLNGPERFARLMEASQAALTPLPDALLGVAPHSLRAVTPDELELIRPLAPRGPVHIHAAEQTREVDDCLAWSGQRPVEWLLNHADVDESWCLIHATHLAPSEIQRLAGRGAVAGLCPITEANLGDGVFPTGQYLDAGGRFGIGTDSNILIDVAQELRALEYAQRLTLRSRNVLGSAARPSTGASLVAGALAGGHQALGRDSVSLAVGAPAEFVVLDPDHLAIHGRQGDALLDGWAFAGDRGVVKTVWRQGLRVVEGGRHKNREAISARYRRALDKLLT
jgi:formiminoglutamate deiminase